MRVRQDTFIREDESGAGGEILLLTLPWPTGSSLKLNFDLIRKYEGTYVTIIRTCCS